MKEELIINPIDKAKTICSCRKVSLLDVKTCINKNLDQSEENILSILKNELSAGAKCGCCVSSQKDVNNRKKVYLVNYIS